MDEMGQWVCRRLQEHLHHKHHGIAYVGRSKRNPDDHMSIIQQLTALEIQWGYPTRGSYSGLYGYVPLFFWGYRGRDKLSNLKEHHLQKKHPGCAPHPLKPGRLSESRAWGNSRSSEPAGRWDGTTAESHTTGRWYGHHGWSSAIFMANQLRDYSQQPP